MTNTEHVHALRQIARTMALEARGRAAERETLRRDPRLPHQQWPAIAGQFDEQSKAARAVHVERARGELAAFRAAHVRPAPDFRPSSAAHAAWASGKMAQAPFWTPFVMRQELAAAIANGDTATIAAVLPLASSYNEAKKEFSGKLTDVLLDAQAALDAVPEVQASRSAAALADAIARELFTLDGVLGAADDPVEQLDVYQRSGAFANLLPPDGTP